MNAQFNLTYIGGENLYPEFFVFFSLTEVVARHCTVSICNLPPEVMLNIFSYLSPQELCRCSQVNSKWAQLAKTGSLWKHLYPVLWARGERCLFYKP